MASTDGYGGVGLAHIPIVFLDVLRVDVSNERFSFSIMTYTVVIVPLIMNTGQLGDAYSQLTE